MVKTKYNPLDPIQEDFNAGGTNASADLFSCFVKDKEPWMAHTLHGPDALLDPRPGTYGYADFAFNEFKFPNVPVGYAVRVLRIYGGYTANVLPVIPQQEYSIESLIMLPHYLTATPKMRRQCGVLWGLEVMTPIEAALSGDGPAATFMVIEGSEKMYPGGAACFLYSQEWMGKKGTVSEEFNLAVNVGGLCVPNGVGEARMRSKLATFLNTIGPIHMEISFVAVARYEKIVVE